MLKWIQLTKRVNFECVHPFSRYRAIGKKLAFEISWHYGRKQVVLEVDDLITGNMIELNPPNLMVNGYVQNNRAYFVHYGVQNDITAWMKAITYIEKKFKFRPILRGINDGF